MPEATPVREVQRGGSQRREPSPRVARLLSAGNKRLRSYLKRLLRITPESQAARARKAAERQVAQARKEGSAVRIVVGSSNLGPQGWILTNARILDVRDRSMWLRYGSPGSIDNLYAEHVLEHLTYADAKLAAKNCFEFLKPGGCFRVAVPDGYQPDPDYIEQVRVGGSGPGAEDHKVLYTYKTLAALFEEAGFGVRLLEYFDENGDFQAIDWSDDGGRVMRSRRYDPRNSPEKLVYSSLILDAVRPQSKTPDIETSV